MWSGWVLPPRVHHTWCGVFSWAQVLLLLAVDVLEHCVASVRQLKGITATYRMTAKGPPVRHSHYVAGKEHRPCLLAHKVVMASSTVGWCLQLESPSMGRALA